MAFLFYHGVTDLSSEDIFPNDGLLKATESRTERERLFTAKEMFTFFRLDALSAHNFRTTSLEALSSKAL